jgi:hypothetical protein
MPIGAAWRRHLNLTRPASLSVVSVPWSCNILDCVNTIEVCVVPGSGEVSAGPRWLVPLLTVGLT